MEIRLTAELEDWLLGLAGGQTYDNGNNGHGTDSLAETARAAAVAAAIEDLHFTTTFDAYWPEWDSNELAASANLIELDDTNNTTGAPARRTLSQRWEQDDAGHEYSNRYRLDHKAVGERLAALTRTEDRTL